MPTEAPRSRDRRGLALMAGLCGLLLAAVAAKAGIGWVSNATLSVSAVPPPVHFEEGNGSANARYFQHFQLSGNKTLVSATVKARAGADLQVKEVIHLVNDGSKTRIVTLRGSTVTNPHVEALEWRLRNGGKEVGRLDYRSTDASVTIPMQAGESRALDLRVALREGAGGNNANVAFNVILEVR